MRKTLPPTYTAVEVINGAVVEYRTGHRCEYLGTDGLWHSRKEFCNPFPTLAAASDKIELLKEGDSENRLR